MPNLPQTKWNSLRLAGILLAASVALVFLLPPDLLLGAPGTDLTEQFLAWRGFAADNLRAGHLPLWNPYTYSGQPFLGGFQSALLYPPNLIFLLLPLCRAANLSVLIHLIILGFGMRSLALRRGLHPLAAGLCGLLLPFSGAVFPHVYAGHLPNICTMAWAPWIFSGLEDWQHDRNFRGLLLASAAAGLQLFAGHVQYFFYTAVAAGLYALVCTVAEPSVRRRALPAVAGLYLAAAALTAAQLFPGMAAVTQGVRHVKIGFTFAGMFSFPPENFLTFAAPGFFGDLTRHVYWGRGYLWEMSVFAGVSGLFLAATALLDREHRRAARIELIMAALLLFVATGSNTPLFHLLYNGVPGFDRFRGMSKFTFPAMMFLVIAIGRGADVLIHRRAPRRALVACALQAGAFLGVSGIVLRCYPGFLAGFLMQVRHTNESYLPYDAFTNGSFLHDAGVQAGQSLIQAGAILLLIGACLHLAKRRSFLRWAPLAVLPIEMIAFAHAHFAVSHSAKEILPIGLKAFVDSHPGDYRVLNPQDPDNGYFLGKPDIWGNDPGPLTRYAEFIAYTQGGDPNHPSQNVTFHTFPALFSMLRFRYAFLPSGSDVRIGEENVKPMARAQLISDYRVLDGRDQIFTAMRSPYFDPHRTVLLESVPYPRPVPNGNPGTVTVSVTRTDDLTVEADVKSPTLLLITDLFSNNWQARPLAGSVQKIYTIMPANYILRAIPLDPGHHLIRIEYVPAGFRLGLVVSAAAWLAWLGLAGHQAKKRRAVSPATSSR